MKEPKELREMRKRLIILNAEFLDLEEAVKNGEKGKITDKLHKIRDASACVVDAACNTEDKLQRNK